MANELPAEISAQIRAILKLYLIDIFRRIRELPNAFAEIILEALVEDCEKHPDRLLNEDPDSMHNIVMHAARIQRSDLEERLMKSFIKAAPGNVDLQADLLQFYYLKRWDLEGCEKQWEILNDDDLIDKKDRESNWRYWVFGALYHARVKYDILTAQKLMTQGRKSVIGKSKSDILRNLADVFIDHVDSPSFDEVTNALRDGISKGESLGYTLATELSRLLQQQAFASGDPKSEDSTKRLREALDWLSVAESTFTNDPNHPVTEIYRARINILMGLENYREAIDYIEAYYNHDLEEAKRDPSLKAQFVLACRRAGETERWEAVFGGREDEEALG